MGSWLPQFLAEQFGPVAAIAVVLNIVLITAMIGLGKVFARHLLGEIRAIRDLLSEETGAIRSRLGDHGERLSSLEAWRDYSK